jgi:succinate dehydrogenase/fumarate reductase flavoprotein subunit
MAGLCAAARAGELGVRASVLEKGDRAGGSMLLSSGVVWRYRALEDFRSECPGGDPALQATIVEQLDDAIAWLESLGAAVVEHDTGNARTVGKRFDPHSLVDALARRAGDVRIGARLPDEHPPPVVLATGGFAAELARRRGLLLRANRWSEGDGLRFARARGAVSFGDLEEFYGRNLPAPPARVDEASFVRAAQLYGRWALVVDERGRPFRDGPVSWSENDLVQATARLPSRTAWYVVDARALGQRVRERTVADIVAVAEALGGTVRRAASPDGLGLGALPDDGLLTEPPFAAVRVAPGVTHTIGGLAVDARAHVLSVDGPVPGLYACGVDAGGVSTGGYASGLAAALVFGRIAAETAAAEL